MADTDKKDRHFTSRKFLAYLVTSGTLIVAALIVKNQNFPALATALVTCMSAFVVGNTAAGMIGSKLNKTDAKSQEEAD